MIIRFIPAGAGNTPSPGAVAGAIPVHPRWRGEHLTSSWSRPLRTGSSPLARGTHDPGDVETETVRFIPAGAGNTLARAYALIKETVHPRWRGEHLTAEHFGMSSGGSSPLARGTLPAEQIQNESERFIPAGAGNTRTSRSGWMRTAVHPRWRGEHEVVGADHFLPAGSSPLARGTLNTH